MAELSTIDRGPETETEAEADAKRPQSPVGTPAADALIAEELLVEEVSIDGMCGVY